MSVQSDLDHSMNEEMSASLDYRKRAEFAREHGDEVSAKLWIHIAEEEDGHYNEFKDRLEALLPQPRFADYATPGDEYQSPIGPMHRRFPQTPGDWEDLGFDIEAKIPSINRSEVRHHVAVATSNEPGNIDNAKRWLMNKAGELGIT